MPRTVRIGSLDNGRSLHLVVNSQLITCKHKRTAVTSGPAGYRSCSPTGRRPKRRGGRPESERRATAAAAPPPPRSAARRPHPWTPACRWGRQPAEHLCLNNPSVLSQQLLNRLSDICYVLHASLTLRQRKTQGTIPCLSGARLKPEGELVREQSSTPHLIRPVRPAELLDSLVCAPRQLNGEVYPTPLVCHPPVHAKRDNCQTLVLWESVIRLRSRALAAM